MKTLLVWVLTLSCLLMAVSQVKAHHGGGGAGAMVAQKTFSERLEPPHTSFHLNFSYGSLDDGLGYVLLYQVQGQYAFNDRFSIGARIPFWTARNDFAPRNTKIGDVALLLKGDLWVNQKNRMRLTMGMDTSFPTGNDKVSLGAGAVAFAPYLNFSKDFEFLKFFTLVLGSFEVDDNVNPSLAYEAGVVIPVLKGALPLGVVVAFQGNTFVVSDTFNQGSTKAFIMAGLSLDLTEHWDAAFLGRVSIIDTLGFRDNVAFDDFVTGLYADIQAGFIFNLGYNF